MRKNLRPMREKNTLRVWRHCWFCFLCLLSMIAFPSFAQANPAPASPSAPSPVEVISGFVQGADQKPVVGALVRLTGTQGLVTSVDIKTDLNGVFVIQVMHGGHYTIHAEMAESRSPDTPLNIPQPGRQKIDLVLQPRLSATQAMEFADQPNFTVAGVTDWTAVGGHGSDASLRTSEDLARQTINLKPVLDAATANQTPDQKKEEARLLAASEKDPGNFQTNHQLGHLYLESGLYKEAIPPLLAAYKVQPKDSANEYDLALAYQGNGEFETAREHVRKLLAGRERADLHRLDGELEEKLGNPLVAVQQDEQAVRMDPSEPNYFAWGSELLLHRAVREAVEVFRNGSNAYPTSARMLAALGAALFATASYDEAALRLCAASDLEPTTEQPYLFLGKVEFAAPAPLPCAEQRLERFARLQPENAYANYLYGMAIWKRQEVAGEAKDPQRTEQAKRWLTKAISIDRQCAAASLQLGIIYADERDYDKAVAYYLQATQANPQLSEAHYRLAVAYDRRGEHEEAIKEFQIHAAMEKQQAEAVNEQRREVKQFQIVLDGKPGSSAIH